MEKEILIEFGNRVKFLRQNMKLTQEQLAQKTGLHKNYIGMVERGERNPSLLNVAALAIGLEVTVSELTRMIH